jgi:hypothetical protein
LTGKVQDCPHIYWGPQGGKKKKKKKKPPRPPLTTEQPSSQSAHAVFHSRCPNVGGTNKPELIE